MELINVLAACGGITIPSAVFNLTHFIILVIQIAVPILLIIWGMIDFAKATVGGDEDAIKKGQKIFTKRVVAAIIVFLVVTITVLLLNVVGKLGGDGNNAGTVRDCVSQFVNGAK